MYLLPSPAACFSVGSTSFGFFFSRSFSCSNLKLHNLYQIDSLLSLEKLSKNSLVVVNNITLDEENALREKYSLTDDAILHFEEIQSFIQSI